MTFSLGYMSLSINLLGLVLAHYYQDLLTTGGLNPCPTEKAYLLDIFEDKYFVVKFKV